MVLRQQIRDGFYDVTGVPGELQLAEQYDVARVTIRRAIADLVAEGLVSRRAGVGTTVNRDHASRTARVKHSGGLLENIVSAVAKTSIRVVEFDFWPCPPDVAADLSIAPQDNVLRVSRVRSYDGQPVSLTVAYLPADIGALLKPRALAKEAMLTILQNHGISMGSANQTISACLADAQVAELLHENVGAALLSVVRVVRDEEGRPIQRLRGLYRPELYDYRMVLSGAGGDGSRVWITDAIQVGKR
jgi:GntR family transcriptional regulator